MRQAVVKLGGSTACGPGFEAWVEALAGSRVPLVVVPGGGPFADRVRAAQKRMGFSDAAAHAMAILAMDQFGHALADARERLVPARTLEDIASVFIDGAIPVWLPSAIAVGRADIAASWDITSDSLAAWLAGQMGADALLLIKQTQDFSAGDDPRSLAECGIVDAGLASMLPQGIDFYLAGPEDAATARARFSAGGLPGVRIADPRLREEIGIAHGQA